MFWVRKRKLQITLLSILVTRQEVDDFLLELHVLDFLSSMKRTTAMHEEYQDKNLKTKFPTEKCKCIIHSYF